MLRLVCLAVLATCAFGGILQECKVSEWSTWGDCVVEVNCPVKKGASFPLVDYDHKLNEARRALNMNTKAMERSKTAACREAGTCPDLEIRKTSRAPADCVNGIAETDPGSMPCENIDMLAFLDFDALGSYEGGNARAGNDIWGWTDSDGDEYSIVGLQHGTSFVRTTDPVNPEVLCFLETATNPSSWRDMKVVNDHAYIVSEATGHGMQVFDLKRLRSMNQEATVPACGSDHHYTGIGQSHNIAANPESGYVYVVGATRTGAGITTCSGGLHMIYVGKDEAQDPEFHGCFDEDGYVHDTECLFYNGPDAAYQGHEICFGYNENTLTIIDVTDKSNPIMVSRTGYDEAEYTHQGWTLGSHTALLLDDEQDEQRATVGNRETRTYFWDITALTAPELKSTFYSEKQSIDHNQYIVNDLTYQSNYEAGLRILEINEANYELTQKAYFQVRAGEPSALFRGTWSNYPYFGTAGGAYPTYVPTTSIDYGLFILAPDYDGFTATVTGHETRSREALTGRGSCPTLMETRTCSASPAC